MREAQKRTRQAPRASVRRSIQSGSARPDLDLRDPRILAEIRRESAILSQHPENAAIDEWIEAVYDWSAWK
jgi:hypothetical protein